jgi:hypothetical protein
MTAAKVRLAIAAMGTKGNESDGFMQRTGYYRHVAPDGTLRKVVDDVAIENFTAFTGSN